MQIKNENINQFCRRDIERKMVGGAVINIFLFMQVKTIENDDRCHHCIYHEMTAVAVPQR